MFEPEKFKKWEFLIPLVLFLMMLMIYSAPISERPFGDVDSSVHWTIGDYQAQDNKVNPKLPYYLNFSYGISNNGKIWYPPSFHVGSAIVERLSGERITGPFFFYAFISCLIVVTLYLFVRHMFGFWPAVIASTLMVFSFRDRITFMWGLWPEKFSYLFIPMVLLCFYLLTNSYLEGKIKNKYAIFLVLLLASQFYLHPMGAIISLSIISIYFILLSIKERKIALPIKTSLLMAGFFVILVSPFIGALLEHQTAHNAVSTFTLQNGWDLLHWYPQNIPYTSYFNDYSQMHFGWWTLPFVLLGAVICLLSLKNRQYLLMMSWVIAAYLLYHLNVIGFLSERIHRFLNAEGLLFYTLFAIGLVGVLSLLKRKAKLPIVEIVCSLFAIGFIVFNFSGIYKEANDMYPNVYRLNQYEMNACAWVENNTAENADFLLVGNPVYSKRKWVQYYCHRHMAFDDQTLTGQYAPDLNMSQYVYFDYSDFIELKSQEGIDFLQNIENQFSNYSTELYNKDGVKIYRFGKSN